MQAEVLTGLEDALAAIDRYAGDPEDFVLPIADALQDPIGLNMAVITDRILGRHWMPAGFEQMNGYRRYRYAWLDAAR